MERPWVPDGIAEQWTNTNKHLAHYSKYTYTHTYTSIAVNPCWLDFPVTFANM